MQLSMKKKKVITCMLLITILFFAATILNGCGTKKINLDSYVKVEISGWDGYGRAKATVNYDAFIDDYATKIEYTDDYYKTKEHAVDAFVQYLHVSLDQTYGLSNGDKVVLTWKITEQDIKEIEKRFNYSVKFSDSIEYKVKDLSPLKEIDPFNTLEIVFEGKSGRGKAYTKDQDGRFDFRLSQSGNLINGQTITAKLTNESGYYAANYGLIPTATEKEFVVEGLSDLMNDFSKINEEDLQSLIEDGKSYINSKYFTADYRGNQVFFCEELTHCGTLFFPTNNSDNNYALLIYKIRSELKKDGYESAKCTFYHPVLFRQLYLNNDGTVDYSQSYFAPKMEHLGKLVIRNLSDSSVTKVEYLDGFKTLEDALNYYSDSTSTWYPNEV